MSKYHCALIKGISRKDFYDLNTVKKVEKKIKETEKRGRLGEIRISNFYFLQCCTGSLTLHGFFRKGTLPFHGKA